MKIANGNLRTALLGAALLACGVPAFAAEELEAVLDAARAAAGRGHWAALEGDVHLSGTTDANGLTARCDVYFSADGRYRYEIDGRLAQLVTFDGEELAERNRSGPTTTLVHEDRETWHFAQWVHSGYWLDPECPIRIELAGETPDAFLLDLALPESPVPARLTLDRETGLPRELGRSTTGAELLLVFGDFETLQGIPVARRVRTETAESRSVLELSAAEVVPDDAGARYRRTTPAGARADDVHFDPDAAPDVELKRARSGHLLVKPLVDGQDVGWFILDSGAGRNCIDPAVAERLDLERFGSPPVMGVGGYVEASFRQGASLELGPMRIDGPILLEIDLAFLSPVFGVEVAGICGYEVFARAVVELDLATSHLALYEPGSLELEDSAWSPLTVAGRLPSVPCRFEGEREGLFKIDLGDSGTVTFYSPAVESLELLEGRSVRPAQVGGVGGTRAASAGSLAWFEIGEHRSETLPATFCLADTGAFASAHALGNLGTRMLEPFVVVFDYPRARIALLARE